LREALARIDNDFILSEPRRKSAKRPGMFSFLRQPRQAAIFAAKHAKFILGAVFTGLLAVVLLNALVWQKSRHPAPLFAHVIPIETDTPPKAPEIRSETAAAAPVSRPTAPSAAAAVAPEQTLNAPHGRDPMAEAAELKTQKRAASRDPIAQLLKSAPPAESSKSILAAQRALRKLGYVIKTDGAAGPAFRQALEQFERDRSLPVHGALSPKIMRELSSQSGIMVE
jgi:hypothetical protein